MIKNKIPIGLVFILFFHRFTVRSAIIRNRSLYVYYSTNYDQQVEYTNVGEKLEHARLLFCLSSLFGDRKLRTESKIKKISYSQAVRILYFSYPTIAKYKRGPSRNIALSTA